MDLPEHVASLLAESPGAPTRVVCGGDYQVARLELLVGRAATGIGGEGAGEVRFQTLPEFAADLVAHLTGQPWRLATHLEDHLLLWRLLTELRGEGYEAAQPGHPGVLGEVRGLLGWMLSREASGTELLAALRTRAHPLNEGAAKFLNLFTALWPRYGEATLARRWVPAAGAVVEALALLERSPRQALPWGRVVWVLSATGNDPAARLPAALAARGVAVTTVDPAALPPRSAAPAALAEALAGQPGAATLPGAVPLTLRTLRNEGEEARWIANRIWDLAAEGVAPGELAVVCAAAAETVPPLTLALHRLGLPHAVHTGHVADESPWRWLEAFHAYCLAGEGRTRGPALRRLAELGLVRLSFPAWHALWCARPEELEQVFATTALAADEATARHFLRARTVLAAVRADLTRAVPLAPLVRQMAGLVDDGMMRAAWDHVVEVAGRADDLWEHLTAGERLRELLAAVVLHPGPFQPRARPETGTGVQIITPEQARGVRFHTVFVPSVVEGVLPAHLPTAPFGARHGLRDGLAALAAGAPPWPGSLSEHWARERQRLTSILAVATEGAVVTAVLQRGGQPVSPSLLYGRLLEAFPTAATAPPAPPPLRTLGAWSAALVAAVDAGALSAAQGATLAERAGLPDLPAAFHAHVLPTQAPVAWHNAPLLSPTAVRTFQTCPRRFFYGHLLRLPPDAPRRPGLAAAIHAALRRVGETGAAPGDPATPVSQALRGWTEGDGTRGGGIAAAAADLVTRYLAAEGAVRAAGEGTPETFYFERGGFPFRVNVGYRAGDPPRLMDFHAGRALDQEQLGRRYFGLLKTRTREAEDLRLHLMVVGSEAALGQTPAEVGLYAVGAADPDRPGARRSGPTLVPQADFGRNRATLDAQLDTVLESLRRGHFPAQPRQPRECLRCDFRLLCDRERPGAFRQARPATEV